MSGFKQEYLCVLYCVDEESCKERGKRTKDKGMIQIGMCFDDLYILYQLIIAP